MAMLRFGRHSKRPYGFYLKGTLAVFLGLCFIIVWSTMNTSSVPADRIDFNEISEHSSGIKKKPNKGSGVFDGNSNRHSVSVASDAKNGSFPKKTEVHSKNRTGEDKKEEKINKVNGGPKQDQSRTMVFNGSANVVPVVVETQAEESVEEREMEGEKVDQDSEVGKESQDEKEEEEEEEEEEEDGGMGNPMEKESETEDSQVSKSDEKKVKKVGPLFDSRASYTWKLCRVRSKYNYIPCLDFEDTGRRPNNRHTERSCPRTPPTCLVQFPEGYGSPVRWPESKSKILYKNVDHPKLAAFIKTHSWLKLSGDYLTFPGNESDFNGGALHYVDSVEEMVPDIEWGKNIRLILDIGCTDASFGLTLLAKEVLTLSLGLKNDPTDLAQVALERGIPAVIGTMKTRRLPFPSGVFDAIHCGGCSIPWHSDGGNLLLEMNRILRPGGYFILSIKHEDIEVSEAMFTLTASICWSILAHKTDEVSEMGVKIYQKPNTNDIYELRRKNNPPLCKEEENPNAAWYTPITSCLHKIPSAIEERGTEWPEEWPQRLESFPDWLTSRENLVADTDQWKAIFEKSYLNGLGIEWSNVRNVMDMKAIYGGFAAALAHQNVWVMNVVPVNAPDTLSIIFERGLLGIYHDWCESFSTYPRSYDLLHADHLFSRLKNRCKLPLGIVVEMDRILRPGGWVIIRDKVEILGPLEAIFRSLHWEIRMTYAQEKEGIVCVQKAMWRP